MDSTQDFSTLSLTLRVTILVFKRPLQCDGLIFSQKGKLCLPVPVPVQAAGTSLIRVRGVGVVPFGRWSQIIAARGRHQCLRPFPTQFPDPPIPANAFDLRCQCAMRVFFFGWPSVYGGADTKAAHLLKLLAGHAHITVVPNSASQLQESYWTQRLDEWGVQYAALDSLPGRLDGVALAMCNSEFLSSGVYSIARRRGLRIVWSSEMMWHHPFEVDLIKAGVIDRLLYVSDIQKKALDYESFCDVPTRMTGNFVSVEEFPFIERPGHLPLTIGRLSRADPEKYPEDFPVFYESLDLPDVRFRVMAWSDELAGKYRWHRFDHRWELLTPQAELAAEFLQSLDLFIYTLGHTFTESWGRSTVEAMLAGAIPLVPAGHHFASLIVHGESGFLCSDFLEFQTYARQLALDPVTRRSMSLACRRRAEILNDPDTHRSIWLEALNV